MHVFMNRNPNWFHRFVFIGPDVIEAEDGELERLQNCDDCKDKASKWVADRCMHLRREHRLFNALS